MREGGAVPTRFLITYVDRRRRASLAHAQKLFLVLTLVLLLPAQDSLEYPIPLLALLPTPRLRCEEGESGSAAERRRQARE